MSEQGGYGPPAKRGFDFNRLGRGTRGGARGRGFRGRSGTTTQVRLTMIVQYKILVRPSKYFHTLWNSND